MRRLRWAPLAAFLLLAACSGSPEDTEKARGVFKGVPLLLAMSVLFIVLALAIVGGVLVIDRAIRTRKALPEEAPPEIEEEDEVVAGITVGRAPVPRWLYGAYVLIPVFALSYVFSNVAVAPPAATPKPSAKANGGPCTKCTISALQIKFSTDKLTVAAGKQIDVAFENKDQGVPHTFTVFKTEADRAAVKGAIADTGPFPGVSTKDAKFTAPAAGQNLYYVCTVHTSMTGTITGQ